MIAPNMRFGDEFEIILNADPLLLDGDNALSLEEFGIRRQTARFQDDLILIWHRLFTLFRQGMAYQSVDEAEDTDELELVRQLWIQLLSYAVGSARLSYQAAVSGYYPQSYTMTRSVFETFLVWKYTEKYPAQAMLWFRSEEGKPRKKLRTPTLVDRLRDSDDTLVISVISRYDRIKAMAHPSEKVLQQSVTFDQGVFQIGPNYIPDMSSSALYEGANAFCCVLRLLEQFMRQPEEWSSALSEVQSDLSRSKERHRERIKAFRSHPNRGDEWIVHGVSDEDPN